MLFGAGSHSHDHLPPQPRARAQLQAERAMFRLLHGAARDIRDAHRVGGGANEPERGDRWERICRGRCNLTGMCRRNVGQRYRDEG